MVATQENDFQNGRQKIFWKTYLHQLANFDDQNVQ